MASDWFYLCDGVQNGPVSTDQLRQLARTGKLRPEDLVWKEGIADWVEAKKISGLFASAPVAPPPPPRLAKSELTRITVHRKPKLTGLFYIYTVKVSADGQPVGEIPGGVLDLLAGRKRKLEFQLPSGVHLIEVTGAGLRDQTTVNVPADKDFDIDLHCGIVDILSSTMIAEEGTRDWRHDLANALIAVLILSVLIWMCFFCGGLFLSFW